MSFVYIKVSAQKNLCKNELLAMVFLCVELSTQTLCIQTVGGAACICQIFRKKLCIYELLAMSCIYQTVNKINRVYIYIYELLAMVIVYVELSAQKLCI